MRVMEKKGWKTAKKMKYLRAMVDHFSKPYPTKKIYECFVKSGEVYVNDTGFID
jgi:hypothetical protein